MMKKSQSSYKNLYTSSNKAQQSHLPQPQSRPKTSSSTSTLKLNAPCYLSNKQNQTRTLNRPLIQQSYDSLQPRLRKQFKLYPQLQPTNQQPQFIKSLKLKISQLQSLLTHKISDEGFMRFFKTSNTNSNFSHIDIYQQMLQFEQAVLSLKKQTKELQLKLNEKTKQCETITKNFQQMGVKHLKQVKMFSDVLDKMKVSSVEGREYKEKYMEMKELCDEIKKQRVGHIGQINELKQKLMVSEGRVVEKHDEDVKVMIERIEEITLRCSEFEQQNIKLLNQNLKFKDDYHRQYKKVGQLSNQLLELRQTVSKKQKQNFIKIEAMTSIFQTQQLSIKQKQIILKQQLKVIDEMKEKCQGLGIERDYEKCERERAEEEIERLRGRVGEMEERVEIRERERKEKMGEMEGLLREKRGLEEKVGRLEEQVKELMCSEQLAEKERIMLNAQIKQLTLNDKKLTTDKYRFILKLQQYLSPLKPFSTKPGQPLSQTQTQKLLHQLHTISLQIPSKITQLQANIRQLQDEKERERIQGDMREESIRLLVGFIPDGCGRVVEEYLRVTDEEIQGGIRENGNGRRARLVERVERQARRVKEEWKEMEEEMRIVEEREKEKETERQREKERERQRQRQQEREREREKQKERQRQREKQKQRQRQKQREKEKQKQKQRQRQMQRQRQRQKQKEKYLQAQRQKQLQFQTLKQKQQQISQLSKYQTQPQDREKQNQQGRRSLMRTRPISSVVEYASGSNYKETRIREKSSSKGDEVRKKYFGG